MIEMRKSKKKGIVPTEMELVLEQTQQEHQSDAYVFTMTMDILPVSTSNSTAVDLYGFEDLCKDGHGGTWSQLTQRFIATCSYSTDNYKDIMKAQVHVSRLPLL
ncbi:hypothetical protein Tco_0890138 [Tanacetum coccineum]